MPKWLLLTYRIPREPTAGRVYVWRKMKRLGAIALQDAVWVLPATSRTQEQFQWLAAEIGELKGEATCWLAEVLTADQDGALIRRFEAAVDDTYREILAALEKKGRDANALAKRYQDARTRDYFDSKLGRAVREELLGRKRG